MDKIVENFEVSDVLKYINERDILPFLTHNLSLIDKYVFPEFNKHNLIHFCNVALLSLTMAEYYNIDPNLKKILTDAALLHDIGRIDDVYDYYHNIVGASLVPDVLIKQEFYQNRENLNLVQALVYGHNKSPYDYLPFIKYNLEPCANYTLLLKILRDADILDLIRIKVINFNPDKLCLKISKSLIEFTKYIQNNRYARMLIEMSELDEQRRNIK